MMQPRVPSGKLDEARAIRNPLQNSLQFQNSLQLRDQGKALYEGKGTCVNCHGKVGNGKGPGATNLNPSPRNFQHHGFWRHRTEGEIFWVIKNGSPGTAMIPFGGLLSDEEIWSVIQYEQTFSARHGHRPGMGPGNRKGPMGPQGGHRKHRGGHESCCGKQ